MEGRPEFHRVKLGAAYFTEAKVGWRASEGARESARERERVRAKERESERERGLQSLKAGVSEREKTGSKEGRA